MIQPGSRARRPSRRTPTVRPIAVATVLAASSLLVPVVVWGHAVVFPRRSTPGAYEKYVLRVPNEKTVATTRVELRFPPDVRVTSFGEVPGWTLEVVTDSMQAITAAVWTGTLPPQRFVELPFVAVNPRRDAKLVWPTYQTYADGERVEWTGPEGAGSPASVTTVAAEVVATPDTGAMVGTPLLWITMALAVTSLGLAIRRRDRT